MNFIIQDLYDFYVYHELKGTFNEISVYASQSVNRDNMLVKIEDRDYIMINDLYNLLEQKTIPMFKDFDAEDIDNVSRAIQTVYDKNKVFLGVYYANLKTEGVHIDKMYDANEIIELDFVALRIIDITKRIKSKEVSYWSELVFKAADIDYNGTIDVREFTQLFQNIEHVLTVDKWKEIKEMFWEVDLELCFKISKKQFQKFAALSKSFTKPTIMKFQNVDLNNLKLIYKISRETIIHLCQLMVDKLKGCKHLNDRKRHSWTESIKEIPIYFLEAEPLEDVMILSLLRQRLFEFEIIYFNIEERQELFDKFQPGNSEMMSESKSTSTIGLEIRNNLTTCEANIDVFSKYT